jgi:hypothetical protein
MGMKRLPNKNWYHLKSSVHTELVQGEQYKGMGIRSVFKLNAKGL